MSDELAAERAAAAGLLGGDEATSRQLLQSIVDVAVDASSQRVLVAVYAPVRLPLRVPGSPGRADIGARSAATVGVD